MKVELISPKSTLGKVLIAWAIWGVGKCLLKTTLRGCLLRSVISLYPVVFLIFISSLLMMLHKDHISLTEKPQFM